MAHTENNNNPTKNGHDLKDLHLFDTENARFEDRIDAKIREILAMRAEALAVLKEWEDEKGTNT